MSLSKQDIIAHRIQGSTLPVRGPSLERGDGARYQLTANLDKKERRGHPRSRAAGSPRAPRVLCAVDCLESGASGCFQNTGSVGVLHCFCEAEYKHRYGDRRDFEVPLWVSQRLKHCLLPCSLPELPNSCLS